MMRLRRPVSSGGIGVVAGGFPLGFPLLFDIGNNQWRKMQVGDAGGASLLRSCHRDRLIEAVGRFPSEARRDFGFLTSGGNDTPAMLPRGFAPIPHVEWMDAVIRVAVAVHVDVGRVVREFLLELIGELDRVGCLRE